MSAHQLSSNGRGSPSPIPPAIQIRAFSISEVDLDGECREVRVAGELDLSVADQLRQRLDAAVSDDVEVLVCLERCAFIDSTGIATILFARKQLISRGRRLLVCNPSLQVSRVLTVTGLNHAGLVYASAEEALAEGFGFAAETSEAVAEVV